MELNQIESQTSPGLEVTKMSTNCIFNSEGERLGDLIDLSEAYFDLLVSASHQRFLRFEVGVNHNQFMHLSFS